VVGSVGMVDHYPTGGLLEAFCRRLGYQVEARPAAAAPSPMDVMRRILPESLRVAMSRPLPRATRERLLGNQFRNVTDWSRTRAFTIPTFGMGFIRINLKGREPLGIVELGAACEALLSEITSELYQIIDVRSGEPAVKHVWRTRDLYGDEAHGGLPDLFVQWKPAPYFMERVVHPRGELRQPEPEFFRSSEHSQNGFVAFAGPAIAARGRLDDVSVLDVAPTCMALLGEPVPPAMTGHVLEGVLAPCAN
jgi:predicted AlkP superfamily phosphohydrolase/phosphomutase